MPDNSPARFRVQRACTLVIFRGIGHSEILLLWNACRAAPESRLIPGDITRAFVRALMRETN